MQPMSKTLILLGTILIIMGLVLWLVGPRVDWFGRLPGDVRIDKPEFKFFAPFTTMLLLSVLLSLVLWLVRRFFE
ncbi:DUF2905 family protein [Nibribacter ruber]|uniref:DUF2905 family protein n=2 Tax=Nibribacter ruber TaxID=2698458 RepID=A0A6P1NY07_9BACT|nr:DUF2905 family protein [Nibribacter ruber]